MGWGGAARPRQSARRHTGLCFDLDSPGCLNCRMATSPTSPMPDLFKRPLDALRMLLPPRFRPDIPVVPVVRLSGAIGVAAPLRPGLMLSTVARALERAFETRNARAVALIINSPGGSPSQSHLICTCASANWPRKSRSRCSPSSRMSAPPAATCWPAPPTRSSATVFPSSARSAWSAPRSALPN